MNIRETAALAIHTGGERYIPTQQFLTSAEVYEALRDYLRRNRWATAIARRLFGLRFDGSDSDQARIGELRGVEFRPAGLRAGQQRSLDLRAGALSGNTSSMGRNKAAH